MSDDTYSEEHHENEHIDTSGNEGSEISEKRAKFKELGGKRVTNILEGIRILGNLSNTSSYEYTQTEVDKIFNHIQEELNETKAKFLPKKPVEKKAFVL